MEKSFAALALIDLKKEDRSSRSSSVSESQDFQDFIIGETNDASKNSLNIVGRYEEMFNEDFNTRQITTSEMTKNAESHSDTDSVVTTTSLNQFKPQTQICKWNNFYVQENQFMIGNLEQPHVNDTNSIKCDMMEAKLIKMIADKKNYRVITRAKLNSLCSIKKRDKSHIGVAEINHCLSNMKHENGARKENKPIKKGIRPLIVKTSQEDKKISCFYKILFFTLLPISVLLVAILFNENVIEQPKDCDFCSNYLNVSENLKENIYGQAEAVQALSHFLLKEQSCVRVACLIGGTGVGKSYSTGIIKKSIKEVTKVFEYFPPLDNDSILKYLSSQTCNLLILENLNEDDILNVIRLVKLIKGETNICATIVAIFNMEKIDESLVRNNSLIKNVKILESQFFNNNIKTSIIKYESIDENTMEQCIRKAAEESNLKLTDNQVQDIKIILRHSNTGCKGVYPKVQVIGRS
ncbi:uncharacterized protein [Prorops nasuta]|uniref:uncharacterized protein n=1 Tax=Prorops nasuta TaxID=863751 RepID=UPI0034CF3AEF